MSEVPERMVELGAEAARNTVCTCDKADNDLSFICDPCNTIAVLTAARVPELLALLDELQDFVYRWSHSYWSAEKTALNVEFGQATDALLDRVAALNAELGRTP